MDETSKPGGHPVWDVFISHASEDNELAGRLARLLEARDVRVWYDGTEIEVGDSIRAKVNDGLRRSRFGAVILSKHYCDMTRKTWTLQELDALWSRQSPGRKSLIPVRYQIGIEKVNEFSPFLATLSTLSIATDDDLENVAGKIARVVKPSSENVSGHGGRADAASPSTGGLPSANFVEIIIDQLDVALKDHYIIESYLATGDSSVVFRARDLTLTRQVAIKALNDAGRDPREASRRRTRFRRSVQVAASLKHRNIVQVYQGSKDQDLPHVVLEFIDGLTLNKILETTGVQPFTKVRDFIWQIGGALDYAHRQGYLHLNLRPSSIHVNREGQPVISPFRFHGDPDPDQDDAKAWKYSEEDIKYQSPEQYGLVPGTPASEASDQYALGLIAYEMLVGEAAVKATTLGEIQREKTRFMRATPDPRLARPGCPPKLARVVLKMLQKEPRHRYHRLEDARKELAGIDLDDVAILDRTAFKFMREAVESYKRCRASASFFRHFYQLLFEKNPELLGMFPPDLDKQYYLLREALELVLEFPTEQPSEPTTLTKVAMSHRHRKIRNTYYDKFVNTLIETVKAHDPMFLKKQGARIEEAWRATVKPSIDYMKSKSRDV